MPKRSRITLTDKGIRALHPSSRDYEVSDARLPGFGVRISPHGAKTFFYRYKLNGTRHRQVLGPYQESGDLANARRDAETARGLVLQGIDPAPTGADGSPGREEQKTITFRDVANRWIDEHARPNKAERSWREDVRILTKDVYPHWQNRPVSDIRATHVRELLHGIQHRGGVMANRTHALVRAIFGWALEEELIEANPATIRQVHREKPPKQILTDSDLKLLWNAWTAERSIAGAAMCLYILTGLRRDELKNMAWSQFHEGCRLELPDTKNDMPHTVPLSRQALRIIEALHTTTGKSPWLFPGPRGGGKHHVTSWNSSVERFREQSGVEDWSLQTLRRTASTILAREGVEPFITDIFLNHAQGDVTHRHYVRYRYAEQVAEANQRLGDFVERLAGPIEMTVFPYRNRPNE